jgi:hypothetical protein
MFGLPHEEVGRADRVIGGDEGDLGIWGYEHGTEKLSNRLKLTL